MNAADFSYVDFETLKSRDIQKKQKEGSHYSAHVLIKKEKDATQRHLVLIEKVPGISLSSLKDHMTWVMNDSKFEKKLQIVMGSGFLLGRFSSWTGTSRVHFAMP